MSSMFVLNLLSPYLVASAEAGSLLVSAGTDVPYQIYMGTSFQHKRLRASIKSGVLVGPYSDLTISLIGAIGTPDVYVSLLESAYDLGSMNSCSVQYMLGKKRLWSIGPELRFDYLTASDTSSDLLEAVVGDLNAPQGIGIREKELNVQLGVMTYAAGFRIGRDIVLGGSEQHLLHIDLSAYKHIASSSSLILNDEEPEELSAVLDDLLWEDVFRPYGYLGGLGLAYSYRF